MSPGGMTVTKTKSFAYMKTASKTLDWLSMLVFFSALCTFASIAYADNERKNPARDPITGATVTLLQDGRYLLTGGQVDGRATAAIFVADTRDYSRRREVKSQLRVARFGHSATLLPDGTVLIFGGIGADQTFLKSAEIFNPISGKIEAIDEIGIPARGKHTATLLLDGRVLFAGGLSSHDQIVGDAWFWDRSSGLAESVKKSMIEPRYDHTATLRGQSIIVSEGASSKGTPARNVEVFSIGMQQFASSAPRPAEGLSANLHVVESIPAKGSADTPVDVRIALQFSRPVAIQTASAETITLIGPGGVVQLKVVGAENGVLAFATPLEQLLPGAQYSLFVKGVQDPAGQKIEFFGIDFTTGQIEASADNGVITDAAVSRSLNESTVRSLERGASSSNPSGKAPPSLFESDDESFTPTPENHGGRWKTGRALPDAVRGLLDNHPRIRDRIERLREKFGLAPAMKALGTAQQSTGLAGIVLRLNDLPLANATVSAGGLTTRTDSEGRFEIKGLAPGKYEVFVDGASANGAGREYGQFIAGVEVKAGDITRLSYAMYVPRIRAQDWTNISSPAIQDLVISHPDVPGLEVRIAKGTVIRGRDGKIVKRIAIVPVPLDRAPFPLPANFPSYFLMQPAGAVITGAKAGSKGVTVAYPNYTKDKPGTLHRFWLYDPNSKGWYVYGNGRVSADGQHIEPDSTTVLYEHMAFGHSLGDKPPPAEPPVPPDGCKNGDPVDCKTGVFLHQRTEVTIGDVLPLGFVRTHRTKDVVVRPFGIGATHNYEAYLINPTPTTHAKYQLILPDGARIDFAFLSGTSLHGDFVWQSKTPGEYYMAKMTAPLDAEGEKWVIKLTNGKSFMFDAYSGALQGIADRFGNQIVILRNAGRIERIAANSGRYLDLSYDTSNRITQIKDLTGRIWTYTYNASGRLWKATYPDLTFEEYTYNPAGQMTSVKDRRGTVMVVNEFDTNGRVAKQTLGGKDIFKFVYVTDGSEDRFLKHTREFDLLKAKLLHDLN